MPRIAITAGPTAGNKRRAATHYGPRPIEELAGSRYAGSQGVKKLNFTFSHDSLPVHDLDLLVPVLPANCRIMKATLRVHEAFAGGTSYDIGLVEPDGTAVDAAGIDDDILLAAIDTVGETVLCNGALVDNLLGIGVAAANVEVVATGTFTAGKATLEVEFEELQAR